MKYQKLWCPSSHCETLMVLAVSEKDDPPVQILEIFPCEDGLDPKQMKRTLQEADDYIASIQAESKKRKAPSEIIRAINDFLDDNDASLRGDAFVYTREEWQRRGEPYGNEAICTLVIDGSPMYDALNYGSYGWGTSDKFHKLIEDMGCCYEQGFAWTVHIYYKD